MASLADASANASLKRFTIAGYAHAPAKRLVLGLTSVCGGEKQQTARGVSRETRIQMPTLILIKAQYSRYVWQRT